MHSGGCERMREELVRVPSVSFLRHRHVIKEGGGSYFGTRLLLPPALWLQSTRLPTPRTGPSYHSSNLTRINPPLL
jgi:hypothetical protein